MSNMEKRNPDSQRARAARESLDPARPVEGSVEPFDRADEVARRADRVVRTARWRARPRLERLVPRGAGSQSWSDDRV